MVFSRKSIKNSLMVLLEKEGIKARQQHPISVHFKDIVVGEYFADLLVEDKVLVELKTIEKIAKIHYSQLLNYLKATKIQLGLLINFGPQKLEYERLIK